MFMCANAGTNRNDPRKICVRDFENILLLLLGSRCVVVRIYKCKLVLLACLPVGVNIDLLRSM